MDDTLSSIILMQTHNYMFKTQKYVYLKPRVAETLIPLRAYPQHKYEARYSGHALEKKST